MKSNFSSTFHMYMAKEKNDNKTNESIKVMYCSTYGKRITLRV